MHHYDNYIATLQLTALTLPHYLTNVTPLPHFIALHHLLHYLTASRHHYLTCAELSSTRCRSAWRDSSSGLPPPPGPLAPRDAAATGDTGREMGHREVTCTSQSGPVRVAEGRLSEWVSEWVGGWRRRVIHSRAHSLILLLILNHLN